MFDIYESLAKATKLSLRLPLPDQQLLLMCDASEYAAGYVLLSGDYANKNTAPSKACARVAFGSHQFTAEQMSLTMHGFSAMHFAFDSFGHVFAGREKGCYSHDG